MCSQRSGRDYGVTLVIVNVSEGDRSQARGTLRINEVKKKEMSTTGNSSKGPCGTSEMQRHLKHHRLQRGGDLSRFQSQKEEA